MKLSLLNNVEKDEREELKANFIHATFVRKVLVKVLKREIESLYLGMESNDVLKNGNWKETHLDHLGQIKAIRKFISILEQEKVV